MTNEDNDIRFMAINDLLNELEKYPKVSISSQIEKEMVKSLLKSLTDKNSEVQNITAKCLGKVMKNLSMEQQVKVANHLCSLLISDTEEHRDIAGISLKMIIAELPINSPISTSIIDQIVPKILQQLNDDDGHMIQLDTLDILSDLLSKFGYVLLNKPEVLESIQNTLKKLLNNTRLAICKRANNAIGSLATVMSNEMFNGMISFICNELNKTSDIDYLKSLISCIGTLCRSNSSFFEPHINTLFPYLLKYSKNNDAELSETCIKTIETLAIRCPIPITEKLNEVVNLSNELVKYDPNYVEENDVDSNNYMDESNDDEENEFYDSGDEFDDELEYSDDDDVSWKVRCASAKLIATLIQTKPESLPKYYNEIAPILINRLNEREDSVYVEILNTLIILVKKTNAYDTYELSKNEMDYQNNPKEQLYNLVDTICKILSRQISTKAITSRQIIYELLNEMLKAKCNLSDYLDSFISSIEQIFVTPQLIGNGRNLISSNLKLEALSFIKELFNGHTPDELSKYYETIIGILEKSANDSFYKITCESFVILSKLIVFLRPITYNKETKTYDISAVDESYSIYFNSIYNIIMDHLSISDSDKEVKENCIICLGVLLDHVGDQISADELNTRALPIILERLRNELTRIATLKTLNRVIKSPLLVIDNDQARGINLTSIISDTIIESTNLLHQSQRQYRVVSLKYLKSVMDKYKDKLSYELYHLVMMEVKHIFSNIESDLHILPDSLNCLTSIIENCNRVYIENNESIKDIICNIIKLNCNVVDSGHGQEALLNTVRAISSVDNPEENRKFYSQLIKNISNNKLNDDKMTKQSYSVLATCIAVICINNINECPDLTENFVKCINDPNSKDNLVYLSLLCLGEIGSKIDLYNYYKDVHININNLFSSENDERKHAAAFALGNIALGNIKVYVPYLVDCINNATDKRYVLLALKETINKYIKSDELKNGQEFPYIQEIWNLLFNLCENATENNIKSIIAECIGKFSLSSPSILLPDLQNRINSTNNTIRSTVITAIRYTFTEKKNPKYDEILQTMIFDFLKLIGDPDLELRRISLSALNSAAYNKPDLIRDCISDLLPLLYEQTNINTELIHTVEMGPFKHQVDDGLEIRKSAFDCMYTLLNNRPNYLDLNVFIKYVLAGLRDPNNEIRILSHLIIQKLCIIAPNIVSQKLEDMVDPLQETLNKKTKKSDVKQEKDKHMELIRSTLRTIIKLNNLADSGKEKRKKKKNIYIYIYIYNRYNRYYRYFNIK
ncbi:TIP120-domain-containing protein [Anaeromyces robustus]|uniref:TIP120-domain-containing protein n=1 Tax=Anaeromyces robustus TaxID=1754192 RepID=A0A1Y1VRY7_9FUNG|nr:TIP120-domain-containing protein [Anaeromyces robustus]|eukprot:ORX63786.1 TIP120-domain-containing protein [Anaeromyces robustus]